MTTKPKQMIALGGGGFSMEPENLALDRYILNQTDLTEPSVCFLPTGSADSDNYIVRFYSAFTSLPCRPSHLSLFKPPTADLRSYLLCRDVIYVSGGNTRSMLAVWHEWGVPQILREAWQSGIVLAGISAGAICWFEQGLTDSIPGTYTSLDALGFLPGSFCPHYDGEPERRSSYHRLLLAGDLLHGIAADDGAAVHYLNTELFQVVSSRPSAKAYRVSVQDGAINEEAFPTRYVGEHPGARQ